MAEPDPLAANVQAVETFHDLGDHDRDRTVAAAHVEHVVGRAKVAISMSARARRGVLTPPARASVRACRLGIEAG